MTEDNAFITPVSGPVVVGHAARPLAGVHDIGAARPERQALA